MSDEVRQRSLDEVLRAIKRRTLVSWTFAALWTITLAFVALLFSNRITSLTAEANRLTAEVEAAEQRIGNLEVAIEAKQIRATALVSDLERTRLSEQAARLMNREKWQEALEKLDKAEEGGTDDWLIYQRRGFANMMVGNAGQAKVDFKTAADMQRLDVAKAETLENIGIILIREGKWKEALEHTGQVNQLYDKSPWNWLLRYIAADKLGNETEAAPARTNWLSMRPRISSWEMNSLRSLLPEDLYGYLDSAESR